MCYAAWCAMSMFVVVFADQLPKIDRQARPLEGIFYVMRDFWNRYGLLMFECIETRKPFTPSCDFNDSAARVS